MTTLTEKFAEFTTSFDYRKTGVASELEQTVKIHLLDSLGIALYSSKLDFARSLFRFTQSSNALTHMDGSSSLMTTDGLKTDPARAAFVNGSLIHGIDFDDTDPSSIVHPSSFSVASTLAVCEALHTDGSALINCIIVSMEIACRIGSVVPNVLHLNGFHPTSSCGAFGAAAGVSRALRLDTEKCANAISIAGSMTSGTTEGWTYGKDQESWGKRIQPGWAALIGVVCASLAKEAFVSDHTMLEGRHGFYFSHTRGSKVPINLVTKDLTKSWRVLDLVLKFYPCGYAMQAYVECALKMRGHSKAAVMEDVDSVILKVPRSLKNLICEPIKSKWRPRSAYSAKLTYPYPIAVALSKGKLDHMDFTDAAIHDKSVLKLARKVAYKYRKDSDPPSWPQHAYAEITIKKGKKSFRESCYAKGTKENPASFEDVKRKFIMNTEGILSHHAQSDLISTIEKLDRLKDCDEICKIIFGS